MRRLALPLLAALVLFAAPALAQRRSVNRRWEAALRCREVTTSVPAQNRCILSALGHATMLDERQRMRTMEHRQAPHAPRPPAPLDAPNSGRDAVLARR